MSDGMQGWSFRNDQIVLLYHTGQYSQKELGEMFGISQQAVSCIVNSEQAKAFIEQTRQKFREKLIETVEDELDAAAKLAVKAIKKTLEADLPPTHRMKPNQDRVAIKILQGRGFLKTTIDAVPRMPVSPEQYDKLVAAVEKAERIMNLDPFAKAEAIEVEVVEE